MTDSEMTDSEEKAYIAGGRSAWRLMLQTALQHLGYDRAEATEKRWILEREEAISRLRDLCGKFGDNDWPNELHLADIIDKHLGRHLRADRK